MALTSIADQKTPGRPVEVTFAAETGIPSANQEVLLIGHAASGAGSGTAASYQVAVINNSGDLAAATAEAETKFGVGSELAKMVTAAVKANSGASSLPALKCVPLASTDTGFGTSDAALTAAQGVKAEFVVSCYDATDGTTRGKLKDHALLVSGAQRVENNQYGTIGVAANMSVSDPSTLATPDTQYLALVWKRDAAPAYSVGELAAAVAAKMAGNVSPFNPLDNVTVTGVAAPTALSDYISVGAGLESETALAKGWTPLRVKSNGDVAVVRSTTARITVDGVVTATAYYDVQDFQVLYFLRKAVFSRLNQPDLKQVKASQQVAVSIKGEVIRIMQLFQDQNMLQAVDKLAKQVVVERSSSDRHRFDIQIPVNVIPGLHVVATNIVAGTQFDSFTV
jgi:phage tail sheath gpL-like